MAMQIEMPKHVDDFPQLLWWEADEVAVAIGVFGIGLLVHYTITSIIVTSILLKVVARIKTDGLNGAAFHMFCTTGLIPLNKEFTDLLERDLFV
jgi:conjugal transfer pilus assembly protein TraL